MRVLVAARQRLLEGTASPASCGLWPNLSVRAQWFRVRRQRFRGSPPNCGRAFPADGLLGDGGWLNLELLAKLACPAPWRGTGHHGNDSEWLKLLSIGSWLGRRRWPARCVRLGKNGLKAARPKQGQLARRSGGETEGRQLRQTSRPEALPWRPRAPHWRPGSRAPPCHTHPGPRARFEWN